jgi:hypothetical protein
MLAEPVSVSSRSIKSPASFTPLLSDTGRYGESHRFSDKPRNPSGTIGNAVSSTPKIFRKTIEKLKPVNMVFLKR